MEFPLPGSLFEEGLYCSGEANGHDHLIRVDVLQSLGCNVLHCPFCKNNKESMKLPCHNTDMAEHKGGCVPITQTGYLADAGNTGFTNNVKCHIFLKTLLL